MSYLAPRVFLIPLADFSITSDSTNDTLIGILMSSPEGSDNSFNNYSTNYYLSFI